MRIYVTGAGGFVGSRLVPRLLAADHQVATADTDVDIRDGEGLLRDLSRVRPEAIIHLAAQSSVAASWQDPAACFRVNYLGTRNLLSAVAALPSSPRVLLIGSADEYETTLPDAPAWRETDGLRPRSPYARTKAAAELLGERAARRGLDVVRIRAFNHTGAGQSDRFVASSFARQIAEICEGRKAPEMHVGNLESVRDFLDVEDVVDAYLRLLDPDVPAAVYNIASGTPIKIETLLRTLIELGGVDPVVSTNPDFFRPTDQLVGDASLLREATGWAPRIPLRDTLASLLDYWRRQIRTDA